MRRQVVAPCGGSVRWVDVNASTVILLAFVRRCLFSGRRRCGVRILYVNKISPFNKAGAELRLWEIARRLASHGHEVRIVCGRNMPELPARQRVDGVDIRNVAVLPSWLFRFHKLSFFLARYAFYFASIPAIFRAAREVDVVVDCATPIASSAGLISRLFGKPCVVTVYELYGRSWFEKHGPVTAALGHVGDLYLLAQTYDAYVTLSEHTVDKLVHYGKPLERIYHQRFGVGVYRPPELDGSSEERSPEEVVCISRLSRQKNLSSLLKAWKVVCSELGHVKLRIVGDGSERESLEKLADSLSISGSMTFEGRVTEERKWELLDQASAFAFPSLNEGFPIVVLEGMAAGLPVVVYDLPAFRGFLHDGEHGFVVSLDDHRQMADRLIEILQDALRRREMSRRNAEYARQFSWERATDQEERTLLSVLEERRKKPR